MRAPDEVVRFLRSKVPLFADFPEDRLGEIVGGSRVRSFEANEALAHHGADATHFCIVLSGSVAASVLGDGGERRELGRLQSGDTFGEMALMTGDKLLADFIAEARSEVLFVPVALFQSTIVASPGAVQR